MVRCSKCGALVQNEGQRDRNIVGARVIEKPAPLIPEPGKHPNVTIFNLGDYKSLPPEMQHRVQILSKMDKISSSLQSQARAFVQTLRKLGMSKMRVAEVKKEVEAVVDEAFKRRNEMLGIK